MEYFYRSKKKKEKQACDNFIQINVFKTKLQNRF